jgi:hypothetical protein
MRGLRGLAPHTPLGKSIGLKTGHYKDGQGRAGALRRADLKVGLYNGILGRNVNRKRRNSKWQRQRQ